MQYIGATDGEGGGSFAGLCAFATGFCEDNAYALVVQIMIDGAGGIGAAADAGNEVVGVVASLFFEQLRFDLGADYALQTRHHVGVGMRADGRTEEIERVVGRGAPISQGFVHGIGEGLTAGLRGTDFCAEHAHAFHIDALAFDVERAHKDNALHAHQGTSRGGGHTVLAGAGLGHDAPLAHVAGDENLPEGVVDFVRTGVVEVFAFEVEFAPVFFAQAASMIQRTRATDVIAQQGVELSLECGTFDDVTILRLQFLQYGMELFGHIGAAKRAVKTILIYLIRIHKSEMLRGAPKCTLRG